jgi:hypothetical protein
MICQVLCEINRAKGSRRPEITDFVPWHKAPRRQTDEQMRATFMAFAAAQEQRHGADR